MSAVSTPVVTLEEFQSMPEPVGDFNYELHQGVIVSVTRPKRRHSRIQHRLYDLLKPHLDSQGELAIEYAYRAYPENDLRAADVGFALAVRVEPEGLDDNLHGSPDLAIEVLSPSNTASEIYEKENVCFETGCSEFWTVDPRLRQVRVRRRDSIQVYKAGDLIPVPFGKPEASTAVDRIF